MQKNSELLSITHCVHELLTYCSEKGINRGKEKKNRGKGEDVEWVVKV